MVGKRSEDLAPSRAQSTAPYPQAQGTPSRTCKFPSYGAWVVVQIVHARSVGGGVTARLVAVVFIFFGNLVFCSVLFVDTSHTERVDTSCRRLAFPWPGFG